MSSSNPQITIMSTDDKIIMEVFYDQSAKRIEIQNRINLLQQQGATEQSFEKYSDQIDADSFKAKCKEFGWEPPAGKGHIDVINYVSIPSDVNVPHAEIFPKQNPFYPFTGLPHLIVATYDDNSGRTVSKTQGEIL